MYILLNFYYYILKNNYPNIVITKITNWIVACNYLLVIIKKMIIYIYKTITMFDYNFIRLLLKYNYALSYFYETGTTHEYLNKVKVKQSKLSHIRNDMDQSLFFDGEYDFIYEQSFIDFFYYYNDWYISFPNMERLRRIYERTINYSI